MECPIETISDRVNGNAGLVQRGRRLDVSFLLEVGSNGYRIVIRQGRVESVTRGPFVMPSWAFALRASEEDWQAFWQDVPLPGCHDLMAMIKRRALRLEGDVQPFMGNLFYFKALMASLRPNEGAAAAVAPLPIAETALPGARQ